MRLTRNLFAAACALALASGAALADKPKNDPGFNALDKNNDGYISRAEAAPNPELTKKWKEADRNGDGKLSRTEYLAVMTKKDLRTAKEKVTGKDRGQERDAATGGSRPPR